VVTLAARGGLWSRFARPRRSDDAADSGRVSTGAFAIGLQPGANDQGVIHGGPIALREEPGQRGEYAGSRRLVVRRVRRHGPDGTLVVRSDGEHILLDAP